MGRREKLSPERSQSIVRIVASGSFLETAAAFGGISRSTLYRWLARGSTESQGIYRRFAEDMERAQAAAEIRDWNLIGRAAKSNWKAAAWRLSRMNPARFGARGRTERVDELEAVDAGVELSSADLALVKQLMSKGKASELAA